MSGRLRTRTRGGRRDEGMTLVELLIAMGITGIMLVAVGVVAGGMLRSVRAVSTKSATAADVRIAGEAISRSLRVAYQPTGTNAAIVSGTASSISFYSLINRPTSTATTTTSTLTANSEPPAMLVTYAWNGTCLNETWSYPSPVANPPSGSPAYTWPSTGANVRTKCLMRTTVAPVFSYYDTGLLTTTSSATVAPMTIAGTSLTSAQLQNVDSVKVVLSAQDSANPGVAPATATIRVGLQNVQLVNGG